MTTRMQTWLSRSTTAQPCLDDPTGGGCAAKAPAEALDWMNDDLITTLGNLYGAPPAITQAAVQLLPFGSRASLKKLGVAADGTITDGHGHHNLVLTPFGHSVIEAAARRIEADPDGVADWTARASLAAQATQDNTRR